MVTRRTVLAFLAAVGFLGGVAAGGGREPTGRPVRVVVSIPPLRALVEPLVAALPEGRRAEVGVLVPPGVSEHQAEVSPGKLREVADADVVVLVGLGMEPQVEKFLADRPREGRRVVRFAEVVGVRGAEAGTGEAGDEHAGHEHEHEGEDHAGHEHGPECEHQHGAADPHLWLDPVMIEKLVPAIAAAVREAAGADGGVAEKLGAAEAALLERVRGVDRAYRETLGAAPRKTIVVGHDAWGWMARRYGLETVAIAGLTASEPTPKAIGAAIEAVREHGARVVFLEPQLGRAAGTRVAQATGVPVRTLDPLGDGDWFATMEKNLGELRAALVGGAAGEKPPEK